MHTHTHAHTRALTHTHMLTHVNTHAHTCTHAHTRTVHTQCTRACTHMHTHTHSACTHARTHTHAHPHTVHTRTRTCAHTRTHTHCSQQRKLPNACDFLNPVINLPVCIKEWIFVQIPIHHQKPPSASHIIFSYSWTLEDKNASEGQSNTGGKGRESIQFDSSVLATLPARERCPP